MTQPVAVVGLGPVGATLTLLLARAGVQTIAIERDPEVFPVSRAVALDDEALRVLQAAGLQRPAEAGLLTEQTVRFRSRHRRPLLELPPRLSPTGHPALAFFHQPDLERALRSELQRQPMVTPMLGHELEGFHQHSDNVVLALRDGRSGARRQVEASWLLACDGARSRVRRRLGIRLRGVSFARRWLVVDTLRHGPAPSGDSFEFICDPARPTVCAPLPGGRRRWEFMVLPGEDPRALEQPEAVRALLAPLADVDALHVERAAVYAFHARVAERWRRGRAFLAGDAAHLMPPFAGQGLSTGLGDAHNLAWKVSAAVHHGHTSKLLDSYQAERRPHVTRIVALSVLLGAAIEARRPRLAAARDAAASALLAVPAVHAWATGGGWKPPTRYRRGFVRSRSHSPLVGAQLPQPVVRLACGRERRLDDVLGPHFALIGFEADPDDGLDDSARRVLADLSVQLVRITSRRTPPSACQVRDLEDGSGALVEWSRRAASKLVVIRPDRHVYAAFRADESVEIVRDLALALTASPLPLRAAGDAAPLHHRG